MVCVRKLPKISFNLKTTLRNGLFTVAPVFTEEENEAKMTFDLSKPGR